MDLFEKYPELYNCREEIRAVITAIVDTYQKGGKVLLCGNGGSCADCEHIVGELMKGFLKIRPVTDERIPADLRGKLQGSLPAIALTGQSAILSAFANDVEPDMVYAQLVYGYGKPEDLFVGLSTSGNSTNVVQAARVAKALGLKTVAMTGQKESKLSEICDISIKVPETETYKIQELHLPVYHYICAEVEQTFWEK